MKKFLNVLKTIYGPQRPETTQILSVDGTTWRDGLRTKLMVHLTIYPLSMQTTAKSEVLYAADSTFWLKKMPYLESYAIQKLTGTNYGVSFLSMFSESMLNKFKIISNYWLIQQPKQHAEML